MRLPNLPGYGDRSRPSALRFRIGQLTVRAIVSEVRDSVIGTIHAAVGDYAQATSNKLQKSGILFKY